mmetsp:Transcript_4823/g.18034  ORF Transcript_4823/g.18034 Transcript_4823/m.18034 type:complete len:163 (-) Transcript_4823:59-547(-)
MSHISTLLLEYEKTHTNGKRVADIIRDEEIQYDDIPMLSPQLLVLKGMKIHDALAVDMFLKSKYRANSQREREQLSPEETQKIMNELNQPLNSSGKTPINGGITYWLFNAKDEGLKLISEAPNWFLQDLLKKSESEIESFKSSIHGELKRREMFTVAQRSMR